MKYFTEDEIRRRFTLKLPTGYLSHSQMEAWGGTDKSKESYRKAYYGGLRFTGNMYTDFGNKVTLAMARGEDWVAFLPRFSVFERDFIIDVDGIPFKGSIDQFEPGPNAFVEQKTVMARWSDSKIAKHKQFDRYSLAIEMLDGYVQDQAWFLDVRTAVNEKKEMFQGIELSGGSGELELTGEFNMIPRIVTHDDRRQAYEDIVRVGREIEEDFAAVGHLYRTVV
jgi:hypothetical protein